MLRYKTETRPGLVALYDIRPGNDWAGPFLQPRSPHGARAKAVNRSGCAINTTARSAIRSQDLAHCSQTCYRQTHERGGRPTSRCIASRNSKTGRLKNSSYYELWVSIFNGCININHMVRQHCFSFTDDSDRRFCVAQFFENCYYWEIGLVLTAALSC